jgi:ubiquinone/menaquinone biosynthesis C-methylase UbiE
LTSKTEAQFRHGFEFDFMAQRPHYALGPRWLLEHGEIGPSSTVADIGCGSGIFTQFLLERFPDARDLRIVAVEPSEFELSIMKSRITDQRVTYVQGRAQEAAMLIPNADAAVLCSVIHQIPLVERRPVLEAVFNLLRSRGTVGINTLFYDGGIHPGTEKFYIVWMLHARDFLRKRGVKLEPPVVAPNALQRLSPREHVDLLSHIGFVEIEVEEVEFEWSPDDWEALSKYSVFIQGALQPDIDLAIGSQALIESARAAYRSLGIETIKRGWLHLAARRP